MQSYGKLPNWQIFTAPFTFFNKATILSNDSANHRDANPTLSRKGAKILI